MPLVALVEFHIASGRRSDAVALFDRMLAQTRAFPGAERIDWLVDREDECAWTLYEEWTSSEDEAAYRDFRAGEGAIPELAGVLDRRPTLRRFDAASEPQGN